MDFFISLVLLWTIINLRKFELNFIIFNNTFIIVFIRHLISILTRSNCCFCLLLFYLYRKTWFHFMYFLNFRDIHHLYITIKYWITLWLWLFNFWFGNELDLFLFFLFYILFSSRSRFHYWTNRCSLGFWFIRGHDNFLLYFFNLNCLLHLLFRRCWAYWSNFGLRLFWL